MVFLFIILTIIIMCITIKIKFQIQNLKISTNEKPHLNKEYQIKMVVYTLGFIPILKIKLNSKKDNK